MSKDQRSDRIGILTGGGDVSPLNAIIEAAQKAAFAANFEMIGFVKGWEGVVENKYIDLSKAIINPRIGGTVLKSSRVRLEKLSIAFEKALRNLKALNLRGLIVIGGEDTLSNSFQLKDIPQVLISKTIDNDVGQVGQGCVKVNFEKTEAPEKHPNHVAPVKTGGQEALISLDSRFRGNDVEGSSARDAMVNYFTLGYPTAARKISSFISLQEGLRTTAYSHERIIVVESMGMHAGWLAFSSSMGHPDFIILPEFPLDYDRFKELVRERFERQRHVIVVVAEGAKFGDNSYMSADENEKDDFGHPRFRGSAEVLAKRLKRDLARHFNTRNVNSVNPSYLYRSGAPSSLDFHWAQALGKEAVNWIVQGNGQSVFLTIKKERKGFGVCPYLLADIHSFETFHRFVDERFYDPANLAATEEGKKYLSRILKEFPRVDYGLGGQ